MAGHLASGALCAVVTATNSFVTAPIARELGVPHLVATEPETRGRDFTGKPSGIPCFREGKVARLEQWLGAVGRPLASFAASSFYSDSHTISRSSSASRARSRSIRTTRSAGPPKRAGGR